MVVRGHMVNNDGPLLRVATIRRTTDTFLFISHITNVFLFKFRIIKERLGSVASGTHCIINECNFLKHVTSFRAAIASAIPGRRSTYLRHWSEVNQIFFEILVDFIPVANEDI